MSSLKIASREALTETPDALVVGIVVLIAGDVVSGTAPVVKLQDDGATSVFPARSLMAVVSVSV